MIEQNEKTFARSDQPQQSISGPDLRVDDRGGSGLETDSKHPSVNELTTSTTLAETEDAASHDGTCQSFTCRWCDKHEIAHDTPSSCEFSPRACNCMVDYGAARARTPEGGYTVAEWMDEMTEQHTTMTAVMRELLAELKRCDAAGEFIDLQSDLIVRAHDTVGVIYATEREMRELGFVED